MAPTTRFRCALLLVLKFHVSRFLYLMILIRVVVLGVLNSEARKRLLWKPDRHCYFRNLRTLKWHSVLSCGSAAAQPLVLQNGVRQLEWSHQIRIALTIRVFEGRQLEIRRDESIYLTKAKSFKSEPSINLCLLVSKAGEHRRSVLVHRHSLAQSGFPLPSSAEKPFSTCLRALHSASRVSVSLFTGFV